MNAGVMICFIVSQIAGVVMLISHENIDPNNKDPVRRVHIASEILIMVTLLLMGIFMWDFN